jgi:hypothetical protein
MSRANRNRLAQERSLAEAFKHEPQDPEMSRRFGRTLPVTVRLPKKTVTPGALERTREGQDRDRLDNR